MANLHILIGIRIGSQQISIVYNEQKQCLHLKYGTSIIQYNTFKLFTCKIHRIRFD